MKQYVEETAYAKDVSFNSKIERMQSVKKAQGNMQSRQMEISILESVGMSERQVRCSVEMKYGADPYLRKIIDWSVANAKQVKAKENT